MRNIYEFNGRYYSNFRKAHYKLAASIGKDPDDVLAIKQSYVYQNKDGISPSYIETLYENSLTIRKIRVI